VTNPENSSQNKALRLLLAVRPAEWVVLAFAGYLLLKMALAGFPEASWANPAPRADVLSVVLAVAVARMVQRYRGMPWPEDSGYVRAHWMMFPFALVPLGLDFFFLSTQPYFGLQPNEVDSPLLTVVWSLHWLLRRWTIVGLPTVLLWVTLGVHLKQYDRVDARRLVLDSLGKVLGTVREWAPPVLLVYFYGLMGAILDRRPLPDQDALLWDLDTKLFLGHNPTLLMQSITTPAMSSWMAFCYGFYASIYPICFGVAWWQKSLRFFHELALAITLGLAIGFVGYTLVPAIGPLYTQTFTVNLDAYYFNWVREQTASNRIARDCCPSLHTCISLLFLWGAYRHQRRLFWGILPMVVMTPIACVYLRYHYVVDTLAGALLALFVSRVTPRVIDGYERAHGFGDGPAAPAPPTNPAPAA
jgi:hypothetical protein